MTTEYKGTKTWMDKCFGYLNSAQFIFASLELNSFFNKQPIVHEKIHHSFTPLSVQHGCNSLNKWSAGKGWQWFCSGSGTLKTPSSRSLICTNSQPKVWMDSKRFVQGQALLPDNHICSLKMLAAGP